MASEGEQEGWGNINIDLSEPNMNHSANTAATEHSVEDESPEMDAQGSAVQIAENPVEAEEEEEEEGILLGDRFEIYTPVYGGSVTGIIYYLDDGDRIRILPDGISNKLYEFKIIDGDFDPELKITQIKRLAKGRRLDSGLLLGFTDLMNFEVGQTVYTFNTDESQGPELTITAINPVTDSIQVKDTTGAEREIQFGRIGIPLTEGFVVMQTKMEEGEDIPLTPEQIITDETARQLAVTQGVESAIALGEDIDEFEEIGELEIPEFVFIKEIAATDVIYPELSQKSDLLADLVSILDEPSQQNPHLLKRIRGLVEMASSLKNSIIQRAEDGRPMGEVEKISLESMADVLTNRIVPIVRPVLKTKRVLFARTYVRVDYEQFELRDLLKLVEDSEEYLNTLGNILPTEGGVGTPRWFQALSQYFQEYPMGDKYGTSMSDYKFAQDSEYFRTGEPGAENIQGTTGITDEGTLIIENIDQSLRRGHGPTMRPLDKGGVEVGIPADRAQIDSYVLFPYKAVQMGAIGATRTGQLWEDMVRSMSVKTWMSKLVNELGGVTTAKDAQSIIHIPNFDADATGIPFSEYLQFMLDAIVPRGPGDIIGLKRDLGINDSEPNVEQQRVIQERIQSVIQSLIARINQIREQSETEQPKAVIHPIFEGDFLQRTLSLISQGKHEILEQIAKDMAARTPGYRQVDIALTATMMLYAQDYFLAVLGGQSSNIERERIRASRDRLIKTLQDSLALDRLKKEAGRPPERNPCAHVAALVQIRKIPDDVERMGLLTKYIAKFRGERKDNWEMCTLCKKELICHHEVLQVQQFLHPMERATIQKEIILNYAGGTFGAKHICRNCGLDVADVDFEKGIEYDDDGRPMMGRAVLDDKDADETENLALLFGVRVEKDTDIDFQDSTKNEFYKLARVIVDFIGVQFDELTYRKLVDRAVRVKYKVFVNRDVYMKHKTDKATKITIQDYSKYSAKEKIALTAVLILLEIQAHRPNYMIRFVVDGCKPGFDGYPLNADNADTEEKRVGIEYITCALTGIVQTDAPWSQGFQTISSIDKRKKTILNFVLGYIKILAADVEIQEELDRKRAFLRETVGSETGRPDEIIPAGFLPKMMTRAESAEVAANHPVVEEGARGELGDILLSDKWIRTVNHLVKQNTMVIKGSPFAETACCFDPITSPGAFWNGKDELKILGTLQNKYNLLPSFIRQTIFTLPIHPARPIAFTATAPLSKAYNVYFKICWKGPRVGLAHEIGYDHKCDWCGIELPTQYLYPDVNKYGESIKNEEEIRSALDMQGIQVTEQSFQALLDASHRRTEFKSYVSPETSTAKEIIDGLSVIEDPPIESWSTRIEDVLKNLRSLPAEAGDIEIAEAYGPFEEGTKQAHDKLTAIFPVQYAILKKIIDLPQPQSIFEIMRSYFLIPSQRLLENYEIKPNQFISDNRLKLSPEHKKELNTMLKNHCEYITLFKEAIENSEVQTSYKLSVFVKQLTFIFDKANELRVSRVIDGFPSKFAAKFLQELIRIMVIGPIGDLINEDVNTIDENGNTYDDIDHTQLQNFITYMINQYNKEALSYNPDTVRRMIEDKKEVEKQRFISDLDKLSEEDRKIELQKKSLGIGRWAIGGTKLVWQYNADQWEENRENVRNYEALVGMSRYGPEDTVGHMYDGIGMAVLEGGDGGYDGQNTGVFEGEDE